MTYEDILDQMDQAGLVVKEKDLQAHDGLIVGDRVAIRRDLPTTEKAQIAAEEYGHALTAVGDITDYTQNWKTELKGRAVAYDLMVGLHGLIRCFEAGCHSAHEAAELLDVTPRFFAEAVDYYRQKFGAFVRTDNYLIYFEPRLTVCKMMGV